MVSGDVGSRVHGLSRRRFLAAGCVALASAHAAAAQSEAEILVAAMQDGGKVIYLRYAATNHSEIDSGRLDGRTSQRNLSPAGVQQARDLGDALRLLQIPLNDILASPVFRARDTAELAFGAERVIVTMDLVADDYAGSGVRAMLDATRRLLSTPPRPGHNRILVGHIVPLETVTGRRFPELTEGAMAVFLPGAGEPRLLGTISAALLIQSARVRR